LLPGKCSNVLKLEGNCGLENNGSSPLGL